MFDILLVVPLLGNVRETKKTVFLSPSQEVGPSRVLAQSNVALLTLHVAHIELELPQLGL